MTEESASASAAVTLNPSPEDTVSRVAFNSSGDTVLASTWAGTVSLHGTTTGALQTEAKRHTCALLDAAWDPTGPQLYATALDGSVLTASIHDAGVAPWRTIGSHTAAARSLVSGLGPTSAFILTGGWDSVIRAWDPRVPSDAECSSAAVFEVNAGGKIFGAARCGPNCAIVITSERRVLVLDVRKPGISDAKNKHTTQSFLHDRAPPTLAHQLRGISATEDGSQYVVGSTEGRVAVEWLEKSDKESYSFRCHRVDGLAFPVNCIAHNSRYGSFATGGGDGHVAFWDGEARKRIAQYPRYPTSIASIDFDSTSRRLAVAVSYTFEEGEKDHPPDDVHVLAVEDLHIVTKVAKQRESVQPSDATPR